MNIDGSKFIVTGGASGMGRCFTNELAKLGADVVFCDLSEDGISAVEAECAGHKGSVKGLICNVADEEQVNALISKAADDGKF